MTEFLFLGELTLYERAEQSIP